jgi:hypothetical protein
MGKSWPIESGRVYWVFQQTCPSFKSLYFAVGFVHILSAIHCLIAKADWARCFGSVPERNLREGYSYRKVALPAGWFGVDIGGGGGGRC